MSLMNIDANVFELLRNKIQQCRKRIYAPCLSGIYFSCESLVQYLKIN